MKEMRRKKQALSKDDCITVLKRNEFGVLGTHGLDGYPYGVPVNYSYNDGKIIFHGAGEGYKLDIIRENPKVCFTVIDTALEDYDAYSSFFRSVIVFGSAIIIKNREEKIKSVTAFAETLSPGNPRLQEWINRDIDRMSMVEINVEHITGKESIEYVRDSKHLRQDKPEKPIRNTVQD